jgi:hypothetical protein
LFPLSTGLKTHKLFSLLSMNVLATYAVPSSSKRALNLACDYDSKPSHYLGDFCDMATSIAPACVEAAKAKLRRSKACGLNRSSPEHLSFCHPIICSILLTFYLYTGHWARSA